MNYVSLICPSIPFLPEKKIILTMSLNVVKYNVTAGWSSLEAREAHNLKVAGSNPAPAILAIKIK